MVSYVYRLARRIAVGVIGFTLLVMGVAMLVLPGPGIGGIIAGLAVLSLEFAWAKRWLAQVREHGSRALARFDPTGRFQPPPQTKDRPGNAGSRDAGSELKDC